MVPSPYTDVSFRRGATKMTGSIFSPLETSSIKNIWETIRSWHSKCSLPADVYSGCANMCFNSLFISLFAFDRTRNAMARLSIKVECKDIIVVVV